MIAVTLFENALFSHFIENRDPDREPKQTTTNFSLSFGTWIFFLRTQLKSSATFEKVSELDLLPRSSKEREENFQVTFSPPPPLSC